MDRKQICEYKNLDGKFVMNQFYEENSKTQIVTKVKNSNYDNSKTQIWTKLKTLIVTKLTNSSCDRTQNLKLWRKKNPKTEIVTKLRNSNWDKY